MANWATKRFWEKTEVVEAKAGFEVLLDGRAVRTPAKAPFSVPTRVMADRICAEWDAQVEKVDPNTMPATRGANAAIDKLTIQFDDVAQMLSDYGDSDLLCYRATYPDALISRQAETWDPLLDWAAKEYGARLEARSGVMHLPQDGQAIAALSRPVFEMTNFELAGFHDLVALSGSLVIALAVTKGAVTVDEAWRAAQLDEFYQAETWGEDEEAAALLEGKRIEFEHAAWFYEASTNIAQ